MKKILSIVLTLMMAFSMFTTVSAATVENLVLGTFTTITDPFLAFEDMSIGVKARRSGTTDYTESSLSIAESQVSSGVGVDFSATLDMKQLRDFFDGSYFIDAWDDAAKGEFYRGKVTTEIEVTISHPGVTIENPGTAGSLTDDNGLFYEDIARVVNTNEVKVHFAQRNAITVTELLDSLNNADGYLSDLTFELPDAAKYTAEGEHTLNITMLGTTTITFDNQTEGDLTDDLALNVGYTGSGSYKVTIYRPSTGGSGTSRYSITYETNDGTQADREIYARNATVKLTKVPVREGYIFEGWYLDKELTQRVTEIKLTKNTTLYAKWVEDNGTAGNGHETPEILNGEEHFAYVVGYPDGTVKPNDNISRAEVTTIFFRLLKETERDAALANSNNFSDVNEGDWYNTAVSTMAKLGIVNGRAADEFVPNAFITRAEFAAICARLDDSEFEATDDFADVSGHWAENEIHEAAAHGWIRGYEDNTFKPDQFITRAEAMTMINRVLNRIPETTEDLLDSMKQWSDNSDESAWYYLPVQEATNSHDYDMKNHIYEKWTALKDDIDWAKYE